MLKKLVKGIIFRDLCLEMKFDKEIIEIFTYIDEVTGGKKDNIETPEKLSLWGEISLLLFSRIRPITKNILKLYRDEEFRDEWYAKYEFFRDSLIDLKMYPNF